MNSRFKIRNERRLILFIAPLFLIGVFLFWGLRGHLWTTYDSMALDYFHRLAVERGCGPKSSFMPRITYLVITDETYHYFGKNVLDRKDLARINLALSQMKPQTVAYDMIFAMPGPLESDLSFAQSLLNLASVYLPVGCALSEEPEPFKWKEDDTGDKFQQDHLIKPVETGNARPFHANRILMQQHGFRKVVRGTGDISVRADPDGVYRHIPMLIRVGDGYLPTLSLTMFLDQAGISPEDMIIKWGESITLPVKNDDGLDYDITIPIDQRGRAFVPFVAPMGEDFPEIAVHTFLQTFEDDDLRGNLAELFEGNVVLIADMSTGIADLGATPLEKATSLVTLHASVLNALMTRTFYSPWDSMEVMLFLSLICILFGLTAIFRLSWLFYGSGIAVLIGLIILTWTEFIHFRLFPVATVASAGILLFSAMVIALESAATRDRSLIRNVFSRYVPEAVINELLANPDNLNLGGEERIATVLFSDIADFTVISERLAPKDLVSLLNHYLTEMTAIILDEGGIIDKFQGDAIMAEFGVPLFCQNHADRAVAAGLRMQRRLVELRREWKQKGMPELHCRVGINTGKMVVGNMGSKRVLDYTVIGDAVNLASRLEGANKFYGTALMISEFTFRSLTLNRYRSRMLDVLRVKGKSEAVKVHEVYGYQEDHIEPKQNAYYMLYDQGYAEYLDRDFTLAAQSFQKTLALMPGDPAARQMLNRINRLSPEDLPREWDGSVALTSK
jgi:adenylate cyclase